MQASPFNRIDSNATVLPFHPRQRRSPVLKVGLVGHQRPAGLMAQAHRSEARAQGIDLQLDILDPSAKAWAPTTLSQVMDKMVTAGFSGALISGAHRQAAVSFLDELTPTTREVGAVTTIAFRNGRRLGHNSISWAFAEAMRRMLPGAKRDRVLVMGAGVLGATIAHALGKLEVGQILVYDPNVGLADALAQSCGGRAVTDLGQAAARVDGIINAGPTGRRDCPGMPIPAELIRPTHWVADTISSPFETDFIRQARARGCTALNGIAMSTYRAIHDFHMLTGLAPDAQRMCQEIEHTGLPYAPSDRAGVF